MKEFFNVKLEFDHQKLEEIIIRTANEGKGYCCFVDLNSLVYANNYPEQLKVLNEAIVNSCDGSYIAMSASKIYNQKFKEYIGPDFFKKFIYKNKKHLIIGNTQAVFDKVVSKVAETHQVDLNFLSLPFKEVCDFNYQEIGNFINELSPNYIWVSLGAPKQEKFMNLLLPHINRGVVLGVGAAINYFSGEIKDIPAWIKSLHLIWVYRLFTEPRKQFKRLKNILLYFPKIYFKEKKLNAK